MSLIRFSLDLAIPEKVYSAIPADKKTAFRARIRELKALAVKINAGLPNEEMTVRAVFHICHHDTSDQPCEAEQEI